MKTTTALQKLRNVSLSTLLSASLLRKQRRLLFALWDRPVSVRPALPALLPVRWTKNSPVFLWAVSMMKLKSAGTAVPTSVPCRGASSKPLPMQKQKTPFFFWMKSIKWAPIFAAIPLRRSWKRSIRNKTKLSTIITLISPSICQKCFSWPRRTPFPPFRRHSLTVWNSSSSRDIRKKKKYRLQKNTSYRGSVKETG